MKKMLRKMQASDLEMVMKIWLSANLEAHSFVPAEYWHNNLPTVREILPQAEVYVYTHNNEILGFIGLQSDYIAGIFVNSQARSQGIGKQLLDFAKTCHNNLTLNVYQQNVRAIKFYQRENFKIDNVNIDPDTGLSEIKMFWQA